VSRDTFGLGDAFRCVLSRADVSGITASGDELTLPMRTVQGLRDFSVSITSGSRYAVRCDDIAVITACQRVRKQVDLASLLESFDGVTFEAGPLGWCLAARAGFALEAAVAVLTLRDAAISLIALAHGLALASRRPLSPGAARDLARDPFFPPASHEQPVATGVSQ
jgi:hypothetical protein